MKVYLDASALTSLMLRDRHFTATARWIEIHDPILGLSDLTWGEFVAALGANVRSGAFDEAAASALLADKQSYVGHLTWTAIDRDDLADGTTLVERFDLALRLPDAIHIAVAQRLGATLVTTDHQQYRAAAALGVPAIDPTRPE